ncbi:aldolase/citrate lyase family protein [Zavarzinia compransoris]|uniref:HpcH/HpaI aldolase/citrate lyase family protein n=1 Tax=Zavarzinia marina TaxID=2911065 RepID=UPI001F2E8AC0|nr:aldolase/citrate lyase family protein [Zavarzinia marina]MCF4166607.1 aldolase/citrate lyase family protein [Zavarzinia marina]
MEQHAPSARIAPRNVLFASVENESLLARVGADVVDAVILDLEDEVVPANKDAARALLAPRIAALPSRITVFIRTNSVRAPWFADDMRVITGLPRVDAVVVPKVESGAELETAHAAARAANRSLPLVAVLESPPAFTDLAGITGAAVPLAGFTMGPFDLSRALGCRRDDDAPPVVHARAMALMAARSHGLFAVDGPVARDLIGDARQDAFRRARAMGFDAKIVTSLEDAAAVRDIFTPTEDEIALARAIVAAFDGRPQEELAFLPGGATVDRRNLILSMRLLAKAGRALR